MTVSGASAPGAQLYDDVARTYDAVLVMSFGGPDGPEDVLPFLENVTRGRRVPRERLLDVAEHYHKLGGASPINAQNRALIAALETELEERGHDLPIYFGNRNWHPLVTDTVRQMRDDGVQRAVAFVTSGFSCYSGCRQYRENIVAAQEAVDGAPEIDKLRVFFNHPGFIKAAAANVRAALERIPEPDRGAARLVLTAHSIPMPMARASRYVEQLREASRLVADGAGMEMFDVVYQSRSGPPSQPWLEPDVLDHLRELEKIGVTNVVLMPIGFISDHMEVMYDLDHEAREVADELSMTCVRAATVGTAPPFVAMIADLIEERMTERPDRAAMGDLGPSHDICPVGCCRTS